MARGRLTPVATVLGLIATSPFCEAHMAVIGAGFSRTGTQSMVMALRRLGYQPLHAMHFVYDGRLQLELNKHKAEAEPFTAAGFLSAAQRLGYNATVGAPMNRHFEHFRAAWPAAKIILTTQSSPEAWYWSVRRHHCEGSRALQVGWGQYCEPDGLRWQGATSCDICAPLEDTMTLQSCLYLYKEHIECVAEHVPSHQLLVFNAAEGWMPLCKFLSTPTCPDEPFPYVDHLNSSRLKAALANSRREL